MEDITRILNELVARPERPSDDLVNAIYDELRQMAAAKMAHERVGNTLNATALVHEAFLRLVGNSTTWQSRRHFYGAAAESMRRILIDQSRRRQAKKRGGDQVRATLELQNLPAKVADDQRIVLLSDAIDRLAAVDARKAELVKLRYFAGLTIKEAAELLEISTATADRDWAYSRAWLQANMSD